MPAPFKTCATRVLEMYEETSTELQLRDLHIEVDRLHTHIAILTQHLYGLMPKEINLDAFMFDDPKRQFESLDAYLKSCLSAHGHSEFDIDGEEHTWSVNFFHRDTDPFEYCNLYVLYHCMHQSPFVLTGHQLDHENDGSQTLKIWFTK